MAIRRQREESKDHEIKLLRVKQFKDGNITFDVNINDVTIYGMKVITFKDKKDGKEKEFFAFPNRKGNDGNYYNHAYVNLTDNDCDHLEKQINDMLS